MNVLLLILGPTWLAVTYGLAAVGVEPVATHFYLCAWAGLIFTFDRLIARHDCRSLLRRIGMLGMARILFWSAVCWFFYELCNLRLANWYYVLVEDEPSVRMLATFVAFGTVFPGIFFIDIWLERCGVATSVRARPLRLTSARRLVIVATGALFCLLWLIDPVHFYPLVWGGTFLLIAPLNERLGIDGLLRQLQRGDWGPTLRLLLAGFIAGGCWEFFNFWARAKWIYTVPFFDELKLFEMPLLGFVGFPPFAVECACTYRLLVWGRLCPPLGHMNQQGPPRSRATLIAIWLLALAGCIGVYVHMQDTTVTSTTPRVSQVDALTDAQRRALADLDIHVLTQLVGFGSDRRWMRLDNVLNAEAMADLRETVQLYMHEGIGTTFGNQLHAVGITSTQQLADITVDDLLQKLAGAGGRVPSRQQVKIWQRRLLRD